MLTRRGVGVGRSKFRQTAGWRIVHSAQRVGVLERGRERAEGGLGFLCYVLNLGPRVERVCSRDDELVSGLKDDTTKPVVVDYAHSLGRPAERRPGYVR
jgi:hypothetical protein